MSKANMKPALFLHIQKTAGTSVQAMARSYYGSQNVVSHGDYTTLGVEGCASKPFVSGHFGFEFARPLMSGRYSFTFLRDPKDRLVSLYYFLRSQTKVTTPFYEAARKYEMLDFLNYCLAENFTQQVSNNHVVQLSYGYGLSLVWGRGLTPEEAQPDAMLAKAKENLAAFDHVGFVDTFDSDIQTIFNALGAQGAKVEKKNVGTKEARPELSAATRAKLEELTQLDDELYAYAKILWKRPSPLSISKGLLSRFTDRLSSVKFESGSKKKKSAEKGRTFITGTGRAGTTFLVQLLTELGLDTGYPKKSEDKPVAGETGYFPQARAGFERDIFARDNPQIVKSPFLCDRMDEVLAAGIKIDRIIVPVRDLHAAAESRRLVQQETTGQQDGSSVAGGLWDTERHDQQEVVLAAKFAKLVESAVRNDIPITFLSYPRLVRDPDYTFDRLCMLFPTVSRGAFRKAFDALVRPD